MSIAGKTVLILIANGFDENQMTQMQRALLKAKAIVKTVGPEQGLANGWQGTGWGHYFPLDKQISETLGSDFDILVLPGGERGIAKLKTNLHTRRIVNHFVEADKPITAIGAGVSLLALSGKISGRSFAAPAEAQEAIKALGGIISEDSLETDGNILTSSGADIDAWVEESLALFDEVEEVAEEEEQAAA